MSSTRRVLSGVALSQAAGVLVVFPSPVVVTVCRSSPGPSGRSTWSMSMPVTSITAPVVTLNSSRGSVRTSDVEVSFRARTSAAVLGSVKRLTQPPGFTP